MRPLLVPLVLATCPLAGPRAQAPADPFAPGLRWADPADPLEPWLPRDVAFAAGGELVWAAPTLAHPHLRLLAAGEVASPAPVLHTSGPLTGAIGVVETAAAGADGLFAAAQFPDPDATSRRTEVHRYDGLSPGLGAAFAPVWTHDVGLKTNGPVRLDLDPSGAVLAAAVHDAPNGVVQVDLLDPASGVLTARHSLAGNALRSLVLSEGGALLAVSAGLELWVLDAAGQTVHHEDLASATEAVALSADGSLLAIGGFGELRVLARQPGGGFAPSFTIQAGATEIAARAAVSGDGSTLAVGWWDFTTGVDVRFAIWDVPAQVRTHHLVQSGPAGGLQNYVQEIAVSADGARIAVGLWGVGDAQPELVLFDRSQPAPVLEADLPGSVFALDVDPSGTRVALCMKDTHANQFATTGAVRLYDTGERDLQTLGAARPGQSLELAFLHPGQTVAVFGLGSPAASRGTLPGIEGAVLLDLSAPTLYFPAPADPAGRADLSLPLPPDPALVGLSFAAQAAAVGPSGIALSGTAPQPVLL